MTLVTGAVLAGPTQAKADPLPTSAHVNFQAKPSPKVPTPSGYTADYGLAYSSTAGSGWEDSTGAPLSIVGNGITRPATNNSTDPRYNSFVVMQTASGATAPAQYAIALANGVYSVTVAVGDPGKHNSTYQLNAQSGTADAITLVPQTKATAAKPFVTTTQNVTVSNKQLVLDPTGGTNVKIDYLDVTPVTPADTTPPTVSISLSGNQTGAAVFLGPVGVTVNAADESGGSGLASTTYALDGGPATAYTAPFTVSTDGAHTVVATATDAAGNTSSTQTSWSQSTPVPHLVISAPADSTLHLARSRVVFSAFAGGQAAPDQQVTFTNTGQATLTVSNLAISGTNASDFTLPGAPTSLSVDPGTSQTVTVRFTPAAPTNCPTSSAPQNIGNADRYASLTFTTNDPNAPTSEDLAGAYACNAEGVYEPTLQQIVNTLGYTDNVVPASQAGKQRNLGPLRHLAGTDEVTIPYFVAADPSQPVVLAPVAHYSGRDTSASENTGFYLQGSAVGTPCKAACQQLWNFPPDTSSSYVQNQKLLPVPSASTSFNPGGTFGIFSGEYANINFSDDSLNTANDTNGKMITPVHYLHDLRVYPAYGPGHVLIPNTYLIGIDVTRTPSYKNNDDQDVVLLLSNAAPAVPTAPSPGTAATSHDLTAGGSITPSCGVTGFDGVLANTGGTQCAAGNITFGSSGLNLLSTAGQLANGNQQNALYDNVNATLDQFTVRARVVGPVNQLTANYQQIAAFFGPDQNNFVKIEAEHNGSGTDPHLTMFYSENGTAGTVATVSVPDITTASTLDLIITGNSDVPDPIAAANDTYKVRGYPLDQLTVSYSINGAAPVAVGTVESPANLATWFSTSAKAGILDSNSGGPNPFTATFSSFSVS